MATIVFNQSSTQYATFEKRFDSNGSVWMNVAAHGALVESTIYKIITNEFGNVTAAQADDTSLCYLGAPEAAVAAAGDRDWLQIGGYLSDMVTPSLSVSVGHALKMHNGAIADVGADFTGAAAEFACNTAATTTATAHAVILVPDMVIATT
jgi:hypothetical protein